MFIIMECATRNIWISQSQSMRIKNSTLLRTIERIYLKRAGKSYVNRLSDKVTEILKIIYIKDGS